MLLIYIFLFFSPFFILLFIYFSFGSSLSLSQFQTRAPLSHPSLSLTSDQTHTVGHTKALLLPCSSLPQALSHHRPSLFNLCCDWVFYMCIHMGLVAVVVVVVVDFGYGSGGGWFWQWVFRFWFWWWWMILTLVVRFVDFGYRFYAL